MVPTGGRCAAVVGKPHLDTSATVPLAARCQDSPPPSGPFPAGQGAARHPPYETPPSAPRQANISPVHVPFFGQRLDRGPPGGSTCVTSYTPVNHPCAACPSP